MGKTMGPKTNAKVLRLSLILLSCISFLCCISYLFQVEAAMAKKDAVQAVKDAAAKSAQDRLEAEAWKARFCLPFLCLEFLLGVMI